MPVSVELKTLNRAIDELRTAITSLQAAYGNVVTVARLRNDLERLVLDVGDVGSLASTRPAPAEAAPVHQLTDEPYDASMWAEDADDEGLGGYHGTSR
jgi:hypothetical protein